MKILPNKTFPHPVLSQHADDYPKRRFQPTLNFSLDGDTPMLSATFQLNEERINALIENKQAAYVVEILCPATYVRRVFSTNDNNAVYALGSRELHRQVEVNAFVVCTERVGGFSSPNFNEEFGNAAFNLEAGDVLAAAPPEYYWWDTSFRTPLYSVMEIVADREVPRGKIVVDTSGEKIQIRMCEADKQRFTVMRKSKDLKRYAMFVYFSALAEVLRRIMSGEENNDTKWYRAVEYKLRAIGKEVNDGIDPFEVAQELLQHKPLNFILPKLED